MRHTFAAPTNRAAYVAVASVLAGVLVLGCAAAATPVPTVAPTPAPATSAPTQASSPSPAASPAASARPITLRVAPDNLGCDTIGIDYNRMTFKIDPNATEQVTALTNTNVTLRTNWSAGFKQAADGSRTIVDPAGKVVVTDGQTLDHPGPGYPRLAGYFVCLGPSEIHVLLRDPA